MLRQLRRRWYLVVIAAVVAVIVAGAALFQVGSGGLHAKKRTYYVGTGSVLIDSIPSSLASVTTLSASGQLASRAPLIAQYSASPTNQVKIARGAGLRPSQITLEAVANTTSVPGSTNSPGRFTISGSGPNTVVIHATSSQPTLTINSQSGSLRRSRALVSAAIKTISAEIGSIRRSQSQLTIPIPPAASQTTSTASQTTSGSTSVSGSRSGSASGSGSASQTTTSSTTSQSPRTQIADQQRNLTQLVRLTLRPLGSQRAQVVTSEPKSGKAIGLGVAVFVVLLLVILVLENLLGRNRRQAPEDAAAPAE